jgi:L,D-peptidoglycan transpeptidase YkuD (ErfK/YbiS/YcfS/YnhG family)
MMHDQLQPPAIFEFLDRHSRQAVTVFPASEGPSASLVAWEYRDDLWQPLFATAAVIGRSGFVPAAEKREGDGGTPRGVYPLSLIFGYAAAADTAMPYRRITADDYWVDDPNSPQYNTWVSGTPQAASWETMLREDGLYRHGIVVEYNTRPVIAGKGSAIFIHIWRGPGEPTAGCVALAESDLLRIIAWLEPAKNPVIVLGQF